MKKWNEARLDTKDELDDIVINDVDLHLERMNNKFWWLSASQGKGDNYKSTSFYISSKSKITVTVQDNGLDTKIVK